MNISKLKPIKSLQQGRKNNAGRNNNGRITVRHQGGGHKRLTKHIQTITDLKGEAVVTSLDYCADRRTYLMRVFYKNEFFYMLAPKDIGLLDKIYLNSDETNYSIGSSNKIKNLAVGTLINNLELYPNTKSSLIKSAGTFGKVLFHNEDKYTAILLPSGEARLVFNECMANIGILSNENFFNFRRHKAGESRWLNIRPAVRGVAMNPIDHPHGGGQGKTSGGRPSVSPWAILTKGKKTRLTKNKFVVNNY